MLRRGYAIALIACILWFVDYKVVLADRLALVGAPANVGQATTTALGPWQFEIVELPEGSLPAAAGCTERVRALALRHGADAVIWWARSARGHEIHLYDAKHHELTSRRLVSGPPYTEPGAASVALSIKTMLRHREPGCMAHTCAGAAPPAPAAALQIAITGAVVKDPARTEPGAPRVSVAALWTPRRSEYTVAASLDWGPGIHIKKNEFVGDFTDNTLGVAVHRRVFHVGSVEAAGVAGVGFHRTKFNGVVTGDGRRVSPQRSNAGVDAGVVIAVPLFARVRAHVAVKSSYFPVRQTYVLYGQSIFSAPRFTAQVGLGLSLRLL